MPRKKISRNLGVCKIKKSKHHAKVKYNFFFTFKTENVDLTVHLSKNTCLNRWLACLAMAGLQTFDFRHCFIVLDT